MVVMICGDRLSHFIAGVDAVGIFRKSGGKQRINHLKEMIEGDPGNSVCGMALSLPLAESKVNGR